MLEGLCCQFWEQQLGPSKQQISPNIGYIATSTLRITGFGPGVKSLYRVASSLIQTSLPGLFFELWPCQFLLNSGSARLQLSQKKRASPMFQEHQKTGHSSPMSLLMSSNSAAGASISAVTSTSESAVRIASQDLVGLLLLFCKLMQQERLTLDPSCKQKC